MHRRPRATGIEAYAARMGYARATLALPMPHPESITVYHFVGCPYCARVDAALRSLQLPAGVAIEHRDIHRDPAAMGELVEAIGRQTVPVLKISTAGKTRWLPESSDIIRYLYAEFGDGKTPSWTLWVTWQHAAMVLTMLGFALWFILR